MNNPENLIKQLTWLKVACCLLLAFNILFVFSSFGVVRKKDSFEEIDVKRLNIVNEDKSPLMVLGTVDGTTQIQVKDKDGHVRTRIYIDQRGAAKMEFLTARGGVMRTLPL